MTRYVIPEDCANIAYSIVSAKRDAFRDVSSICKTRVTSVTVMGDPYAQIPSLASRVQWLQDSPLRFTVVTEQPSTVCSSIGHRALRFG